jgi:hypothetical protein
MGITLRNDNLMGIFHIGKLLKQFSIDWVHIIIAGVTPFLIVSRVLVLLPVLLMMTKSIQTIKNMDMVTKLHEEFPEYLHLATHNELRKKRKYYIYDNQKENKEKKTYRYHRLQLEPDHSLGSLCSGT